MTGITKKKLGKVSSARYEVGLTNHNSFQDNLTFSFGKADSKQKREADKMEVNNRNTGNSQLNVWTSGISDKWSTLTNLYNITLFTYLHK